jgi:PST family polysaccharide transporter
LTFGTDEHAGLVALLSLAVFFRLVSAGQAALLRGMRRIRDLASVEIWGSAFATFTSLPLIYFFRERGVVPSIVATAAMMIVTSWWYSRKISIQPRSMTVRQVGQEAGTLLKLGLAFMASGLLAMGVAYAVRVIVLREIGVEAAGYYQSAWTVGGLYVGFILGAMGTDFYPRLTAVAHANVECNRLVNEQAQVSLLMAGPGLLATLAFTPLLIALFYSHKFGAAVGALRWICLGMSLRTVTWPLGFIVVAKGMRSLFVWIDLICGAVQLALAWILVRWIGLDGAGMAFFGLYVFHAAVIYPVARMVSGFRWSRENKRIGLFFLPLITLVFGSFYVLPSAWAASIGIVAVLVTGAYSLRTLASLVTTTRLPNSIRRLLAWSRLVPLGGPE